MRYMKAVLFLAFPWLFTACDWAMIGDSITWVARADVESALEGDGYVDGVAGRWPDGTLNPGELTIRESFDRISPLVDPGGWIILQDDGEYMDFWSQAAWVADVSYFTPDDRCIAWVLPWDELKDVQNVSDAIRTFAPIQPCHAIVDWAAVVSADPSLLGDGIHPTPEGSAVLAELIKEAISG